MQQIKCACLHFLPNGLDDLTPKHVKSKAEDASQPVTIGTNKLQYAVQRKRHKFYNEHLYRCGPC